MARARKNKDRLRQIERCLWQKFRPPFPVEVRFPKYIAPDDPKNADYWEKLSGAEAETYRRGRTIVIRLSLKGRPNCAQLIHSLIHEHGHAASMRHDTIEDKRPAHDDEWSLSYGRAYRWFYDEEGNEEADGF